MKKRIKVTKQLLKKDDTEKRSIKRDGTKKFDSDNPEFKTTNKRINYMRGSSDPTKKVSKEELEAALAGAPAEKGVLQRMKDYLYGKLFSSEEAMPEPEASMDTPLDPDDVEVPGGGDFSAIPGFSGSPEQQAKMQKTVSSIGSLDRSPEQVKQAQAADRFGKDPEYFDDPSDPDYLKDFKKLQEIAKRHFKKSK